MLSERKWKMRLVSTEGISKDTAKKRVAKYIQPLSMQCRLLVHRWGGHVARLPPNHFVAVALRCRGMQWWRWRQSQHHDKWSGPHPQRFKASRCEEQLSKTYGDGFAENVQSNTGWLLNAQGRLAWKEGERAFALATA